MQQRIRVRTQYVGDTQDHRDVGQAGAGFPSGDRGSVYEHLIGELSLRKTFFRSQLLKCPGKL